MRVGPHESRSQKKPRPPIFLAGLPWGRIRGRHSHLPKSKEGPMASLLEVSCACGYRRLVRTGGLMRTFREESWWPFHCSTCGVVNVNWRKDIVCPNCGSKEVIPYGSPPASKDQDCEYPYEQAWDYQACKSGHLCPRCKNYSLEFTRGPLSAILD